MWSAQKTNDAFKETQEKVSSAPSVQVFPKGVDGKWRGRGGRGGWSSTHLGIVSRSERRDSIKGRRKRRERVKEKNKACVYEPWRVCFSKEQWFSGGDIRQARRRLQGPFCAGKRGKSTWPDGRETGQTRVRCHSEVPHPEMSTSHPSSAQPLPIKIWEAITSSFSSWEEM